MSFSLFGLYFTYITGTLLILVSYVLEPIFACLYRRWKYRKYTYLEWSATETLQLQRASYQGIGSGTWSGNNSTIPRTQKGEKLGNLPLSYFTSDDDTTSLAGSRRQAFVNDGTNAPPVVSSDNSSSRVSLDDLLLESESSISGPSSPSTTSREPDDGRH